MGLVVFACLLQLRVAGIAHLVEKAGKDVNLTEGVTHVLD